MIKPKFILWGVGAILSLFVIISIVDLQNIKGTQIGVMETWNEGVIETPLKPGNHVLFPAFMKKVYVYDMDTNIFVMNDEPVNTEYGEGRDYDSYLVQSQEGQDMKISFNLRWRRDPAHIIELHKTVQDNVEERIIRPISMRVIKDAATQVEALNAYSGQGLVELQARISERLDEAFEGQGVVFSNFVIEHIELDPEYVQEIKAKQIAVQARLRAIEETKAAEAKAEQAKAEAQADYEKQVVVAERDKAVGILAAQRAAEQRVLDATAKAKEVELAAEADKNRNVLAAQGEKEAALLRAQAIEALGKAEAEATRLKLSAYSAEGSEAFVRIEVAKSMSEAFKNIQGYLPEGMNITLLSSQYKDGVNLLVNGQATASPSSN